MLGALRNDVKLTRGSTAARPVNRCLHPGGQGRSRSSFFGT